uniref:Uncharacterized protein n=1 Tax=Streptococcus suis TaxID=1307 RepID=M1VR86_STRSU|nr:hypothetical protein [Streptococcus suis]
MNNFEWKNIEKKIFCCKSVFQELKLKSLFLILKGNILY